MGEGAHRRTKDSGDESFLRFEIVNTVQIYPRLLALDILDIWIVGQIIDQYLGLPSVFLTC